MKHGAMRVVHRRRSRARLAVNDEDERALAIPFGARPPTTDLGLLLDVEAPGARVVPEQDESAHASVVSRNCALGNRLSKCADGDVGEQDERRPPDERACRITRVNIVPS